MRDLSVQEAIGRHGSGRLAASMLVGALACVACILAVPSPATAGTYPMYQCSSSVPTVAPGWSVYESTSLAGQELSNSCASAGAIGDYVFEPGDPGGVRWTGARKAHGRSPRAADAEGSPTYHPNYTPTTPHIDGLGGGASWVPRCEHHVTIW
jgi:hypothetical protein